MSIRSTIKKLNEINKAFRELRIERKNEKSITESFLNSIYLFSDYTMGETNNEYQFTHEEQQLNAFWKYDLRNIAGNGDTVSKVHRIMQWITDNSIYAGNSPLGPSLPDKILEYGFENKQPINCANRAIIFSDALAKIGVFAIPVWLEHRTDNGIVHCHVIAQVWLQEYGCWGAYDPSFNTSFQYQGKPVDIPSLAMLVRRKRKFQIIDNKSGKTTDKGRLCTVFGLMDISVFAGNAFSNRDKWDERLHFVPETYRKLAAIPNERVIGLASFNKEPTGRIF